MVTFFSMEEIREFVEHDDRTSFMSIIRDQPLVLIANYSSD